MFDLKNTKHLVLYGRNIVESLMVREAKAFMAALADGMRCTYIDPRASFTACKATRYWQVRPNSDYALNLAIIHEVLKQEAYDKDFVARFVSGMDYLREAVKDTTPEWQESHTGVPAEQLRAFVDEIAGDVPHVIFHPGWMTARHKQSFYVSRTALILNALMGNIEIPGGCVLGKSPEYYGRQGLKHLTDRVPEVDEPRVDGAGTDTAPVGSGHRHGAPACSRRWRRRSRMASAPTSPTAMIRSPACPIPTRHNAGARQPEAARLHRRALFGDGLVLRRHPPRIVVPRARQHPVPDERPGAGLRDARSGDRAALRQPPGVVDLPRDPAPHGHQRGARLRHHRGVVELPARRHRRHHRRHARPRGPRAGDRAQADTPRRAQLPDPVREDRDRKRRPGTSRAAEPGALRAQGRADAAIASTCCSRRRRRSRTASLSTTRSSTRSRRNRCCGSIPIVPSRSASPTATTSRSTAAAVTRAA